MRRRSVGHRLLSGWRDTWLVRSRRCAEPCNTTVTPSATSVDTGCGVLVGDGAEQRTYRLNRGFRLRPVRVVLDGQPSGEDLSEVDLDTGADGEEQFTVGAGQLDVGRCPHGRNQPVIGKQDDVGQARRVPDVLRAEMKPRLLDHTVGEVRPKSL